MLFHVMLLSSWTTITKQNWSYSSSSSYNYFSLRNIANLCRLFFFVFVFSSFFSFYGCVLKNNIYIYIFFFYQRLSKFWNIIYHYKFCLSLSPLLIKKGLISLSFKVCLLPQVLWKRPVSCVNFKTEQTRRLWNTLWSLLPLGIKSDKVFLMRCHEPLCYIQSG